MKNQLSANVRSGFKSILFFTALVCVIVLSAIPSGVYSQLKITEVVSPVEVKYLGKIDEYTVFQVDIDNAQEDFFYFKLTDIDGIVLYTEKFTSKTLSRKFQFISENLANEKITVSLISKNQKKNQAFEITSVSKVVEDVAVTRLF